MRRLAIRYTISRFGGSAVTKDELKEVSEKFGIDIDYFVNYLLSQGYIIRILRGVYYVKTIAQQAQCDMVLWTVYCLGAQWYDL